MVSHKKLKSLFLAVLALPLINVSAEVDPTLWDGVLSAIDNIGVMDKHFKDSVVVFNRLNSDYSDLYTKFDVYKTKRNNAFDCIKASVLVLEGQLDDAIAYKEQIEYDASVEQAAMRANIEATRLQRNAIIKGLEDAKVALQSEITSLELDLATLESLSTDKIDEAMIDIDAAIKSYQDMIAARTIFMGTLDTALARAVTFEANQTSRIAEMDDFCNNG